MGRSQERREDCEKTLRQIRCVFDGRATFFGILFFGIALVWISTGAWAESTDKAIDSQPLAVSPPVAASFEDEDLAAIDAALSAHVSPRHFADSENLRAARMALASGAAKTALGALKKIATGSPLYDYARYLSSVAYKKLGENAKALAFLPAKDAFVRRLDWDVFWQRLDLLSLDKQEAAFKQALAIGTKAAGRDKLAQIKIAYFQGKAALLAGRKTEALRYFTSLLVQNPGSEYDDRALDLLRRHGLSEDKSLSEANLNLRAEKLIATGFAREGREIYERLSRSDPGRYRERIAYAVFRERDYPRAAKLYEQLLKTGSAETPKPTLMTYLAQAYARQDSIDAAIQTNQKIIAQFPGTSAAAQAKAKLGFLYFDGGYYDKALTVFAKGGAVGKMRSSAAWYRFWSYYLSGKFDRALIEAKTLFAAYGRGEGGLQWDYWMGRTLERMGKRSEAVAQYRKVAARGGDGYYGLIARQRLSTGKLLSGTMVSENLRDGVASGGQALYQGTDVATALASPELLRAALLARAGFDNDAFDETKRAPQSRSPSSKSHLAALALAGNDNAVFAAKGAAQSGRMAGCNATCGDEASYPLAYAKYVEPFSRRWGIDPALAYAVMRQESAFKPEAQSYAYAYGLMQIIPPTGREIADGIGYPGYHASLLNKPRVNVLFGTWYLKHLLDQLGGVSIYAIAAYNAGPEAVGRWVRKYGHEDLDVFVDLIAYEQTHDYVKKVLGNYLAYRKLYR